VKKLFEDHMVDDSWQTVDANNTLEAIQDELRKIATTIIAKNRSEPIRQLWV